MDLIEISRDELCEALRDLFGYTAESLDGLSFEEIIDSISFSELNAAEEYMGY